MNKLIEILTAAPLAGRRTNLLGAVTAGFLVYWLTTPDSSWVHEYFEGIMITLFGAKMQTTRMAIKKVESELPTVPETTA